MRAEHWLYTIPLRLRSLFRWMQADQELDEELRDHLKRKTEEYVARGIAPKEAQRRARLDLGGVEKVKEECRDARRVNWIQDFVQDLRYGARTLRQHSGFTAAAVLAIALGVGINVGIFSVLNGLALRLLPIPRADEIVSISQVLHGRFSRNVHGEGGLFSYPEYLDYREHSHAFAGLAAYEPFVEATLAGRRMQQLLGALTSCNYFDVLNAHPTQGRGFIEADCAAPGASPVVVISDDLWRGALAGDPSLVGKRVILNHTSYTVIGIAPPRFRGVDVVPSSFWAPLTMQGALDPGTGPGGDRLADDNLSWLAMLGRVHAGLSLTQVRAELNVIAERIDERHPGRFTSLAISKATLFGRPAEREILVPIASVILVAFGLVLLIACANVSNLLLARASVRHKEIALRLSMGASRGRLLRQLLTESLLLSFIGGTLGSMLAFWSFAGITHFVTSRLPHEFSTLAVNVNVSPDFHVLAYALALTFLTGIAFGLAPALKSSRPDLNTALKQDGALSGSGKRSGQFLRHALIGGQIAVCMILLLAAGLLLRGLYHAQTVDPGFETKNVASVFFNLQGQGYDDNRALAFMQSLRERVASLPGVIEIAQAECAPLSHDFSADNFTVPGSTAKVGIEYNHVSPEYFSVVGIPIVRGRGFAQGDARNDAAVVVVTESTARRLWPGDDPIGKSLREGDGHQDTVIGVAKDAQVSHLGELETNYLYFPAGPRDAQRAYVLVHFAAGGFTASAKGVRDAVQSLDDEMPVEVTRLEDYLEVWRAPSRIAASLSGALGALALLLASIGVYGMVSYAVSRSAREIGIRMALGADRAKIMGLVLRQAMRPVVIGALVGMAGCAVVSWVLSSLLFGLNAHDPIAFTSVPLFLLGVAMLACYVPARRAMRVDPIVALRYE
ncbi:MAG TPA: ABC transporter permease [Candidatus Cybelea sp.]|nr:ABC transporter permease [Candidatus Cybelea sp.]